MRVDLIWGDDGETRGKRGGKGEKKKALEGKNKN